MSRNHHRHMNQIALKARKQRRRKIVFLAVLLLPIAAGMTLFFV